jgi:hypothetical protein
MKLHLNEQKAMTSLVKFLPVCLSLVVLTLLCGCSTAPHYNSKVLYDFSKDKACVYRCVFMPVASCSNDFVVVSRDQIYRISNYDFKNPKLICDARRPGWEIAAKHGDGANATMRVTSITCDPTGTIYFCDGRVNKVLRDGRHKVVAGSAELGFVDSQEGSYARFGAWMGICYLNGSLMASDCFNNALRQVNPTSGAVVTLLGRKEESVFWDKGSSSITVNPVSSDGKFDVATLRNPVYALSQTVAGNLMYIICNEVGTDYSEYTVRRINMNTKSVQTVAGKSNSLPEIKDGSLGVSRLVNTKSATIDNQGNLYIACENIIRRISVEGLTKTIFKNYHKDGSLGYIKAVVFDKRNASLIIFDDESVKSVKLKKI